MSSGIVLLKNCRGSQRRNFLNTHGVRADQGVRKFEGPKTQSDFEPSELLELLLLELLLEPASDGNELPASPTMIC